ncbi:hypothetical protein ABZ897_42860 [Nonomuraea sp. NPDC046802]|uniref:hypothetical protein n=1 Tax=Nonomuraea sp. NPDC046802 TaxID=3154919 RepID=UPI00340713A5
MSTLAERLLAGAADHEPHRQAAIRLLIEDAHSAWLDNKTFTDVCVDDAGERAYIDWAAARTAFDNGVFDRWASTTERRLLDFTIAIGEDRFGLSRMNLRQTALINMAMIRALPEAVAQRIGP